MDNIPPEDKSMDEFITIHNEKYLKSSKKSTKGNSRKSNTPRNPRNQTAPLKPRYFEYVDNVENEHNASPHNQIQYELGIDEAGRGPMFGPVYVACVVLPPPTSDFRFDWMKDSKRFSSTKKINQVADYIRENAVAYSVQSCSAQEIDDINIRQAVLTSMHKCIDEIHRQLHLTPTNSYLLVDGCDFIPYKTPENITIPHTTIEGGDNWYCAIAAASILAKVERDHYIETLCEKYPYLNEQYGLLKNKGYGTTQHRQGIEQYGITPWHRKTFGMCRNYDVIEPPE